MIEGVWYDDFDKVVLTTLTRYPLDAPTSQSLEFEATDRIYAEANTQQRQMAVLLGRARTSTPKPVQTAPLHQKERPAIHLRSRTFFWLREPDLN